MTVAERGEVYTYQDKIIAMLAFGWSVYLYAAARNPSRVQLVAILIAGLAALVMLTAITVTTDFGMLSKTIEPLWFHVEVFILFFYWLWLLVTYWRARHNGEAAGKD